VSYDLLSTVTQVKIWGQISSTAEDGAIGLCLRAASENIGRYCGRPNLGSVYNYTEVYARSTRSVRTRDSFDLVLRKYPIVSITSLTMGSTPVNQLTLAQLQNAQAGFWIEEDDEEPRIIKIIGFLPCYPITVVYSAGYASNAIPPLLQQGANQATMEILRSQQWIMKKSASIGQEVVSGDMGNSWGLSNRTKALIHPFRDVVPFRMG
jgi:hypothetical protein